MSQSHDSFQLLLLNLCQMIEMVENCALGFGSNASSDHEMKWYFLSCLNQSLFYRGFGFSERDT